ncbi:MAG: hypothetical protein Ct9H300mP3_08840 [Gammaproteobacteria bacterium]|nr:MAG: hypothetical protein Ct9H300mP3_08840 [Gammaproteobacteria bacterium]
MKYKEIIYEIKGNVALITLKDQINLMRGLPHVRGASTCYSSS